ncbi:armadillo repeat-containing protein 1 isoform X2 [Chelonia mydas]|uniref:armadillo repeat-containing protein 1 isoform X2 n=1 Tax=Chelonia mydas TaxID=8469 RepID=UPI001CA90BFD|nr:armadillo repeat-containing protein 1 isoform X2 [Chelonia mydas]
MNSTMSEEPDALAVVNQLRDLAADPLNRRAIVQDQGCLPGLILFLDHPSPPVVHSALLALRYLAECRANREKMKSELGMMLSLQTVIQRSMKVNGETLQRKLSTWLPWHSLVSHHFGVRHFFSNIRKKKALYTISLKDIPFFCLTATLHTVYNITVQLHFRILILQTDVHNSLHLRSTTDINGTSWVSKTSHLRKSLGWDLRKGKRDETAFLTVIKWLTVNPIQRVPPHTNLSKTLVH